MKRNEVEQGHAEVSFTKIASELGITPNGAEKIYRRALRKLKPKLREAAILAKSRDYSDLNLRAI